MLDFLDYMGIRDVLNAPSGPKRKVRNGVRFLLTQSCVRELFSRKRFDFDDVSQAEACGIDEEHYTKAVRTFLMRYGTRLCGCTLH